MNKKSKLISNPAEKFNLGKHRVKSIILNQAKKEGNIIYGSNAIRKRLGINARVPSDFDLFSQTPKQSAVTSEKSLDKQFRGNFFYTKKGKNKTTYKVKNIGADNKARTNDDLSVADYTKTPSKTPKTFLSNGVKYRVLSEELAAKKRLLLDKRFEYRKLKDLQDLNRIKRFKGRRK